MSEECIKARSAPEYHLPTSIVKKVEDYCSPTESEELDLKNIGIKLASEPRLEDVSFESVLMTYFTQEMGEAQTLINEVDRFFTPVIAELVFEHDYLDQMQNSEADIDMHDPHRRLLSLVATEKATSEFKAAYTRKLEVGRLTRRLEHEQRAWQKTLSDALWMRFNIVMSGALKTEGVDVKALGQRVFDYQQTLTFSLDSLVGSTASLPSAQTDVKSSQQLPTSNIDTPTPIPATFYEEDSCDNFKYTLH